MMIHTILDTDLYKFTTSYAYIKLFPYAMGTFSFKDRDETVYTEAFLNKLKAEVANLANVALTDKDQARHSHRTFSHARSQSPLHGISEVSHFYNCSRALHR